LGGINLKDGLKFNTRVIISRVRDGKEEVVSDKPNAIASEIYENLLSMVLNGNLVNDTVPTKIALNEGLVTPRIMLIEGSAFHKSGEVLIYPTRAKLVFQGTTGEVEDDPFQPTHAYLRNEQDTLIAFQNNLTTPEFQVGDRIKVYWEWNIGHS
jgi:hypothetical protein